VFVKARAPHLALSFLIPHAAVPVRCTLCSAIPSSRVAMRSISRLLFVAEGRFHPHKLLGLYAICHFAYRYHAFFAGELSTDMGFANGRPHRTVLVLAPHLALQLSGLRFTIPRRRVTEGSRIWPEYRWHALVFASRSLALMALALRYAPPDPDAAAAAAPLLPSWVPPLLVVHLAMATADAVSRAHARTRHAHAHAHARAHADANMPCRRTCRAHAHARRVIAHDQGPRRTTRRTVPHVRLAVALTLTLTLPLTRIPAQALTLTLSRSATQLHSP
jgi:hypothetical protein